MSCGHELKRTNAIVRAVGAAGYRVFVAERGTYAFFTDKCGTKKEVQS